jgi:hypothetical protein
MDKETMLKEFEKYLGKEYNETISILDSSPWWCTTRKEKLNMISNTLQRGLGAAQIIEYLGVAFEECNELYENFRVKIFDLMDEI